MRKRPSLPEESLLLSLMREDAAAARRRISEGVEWGCFTALAVRCSLAPYLGSLHFAGQDGTARRDIGDLIPRSVQEILRAALRETGHHNLHLLGSLHPFLERLHDRRIAPIVLKGAALLGRVYRDHGARLLSDLDLLVPGECVAEVSALAEAAGLIEVECDQHSDRRLGYRTRTLLPAKVEIHWDLSHRHRFRADLPGVWRRSLAFEFEGIPARRLDPTDEFLYLSLHYAAHYFPASLKWLVDLRELLRRDPPEAADLTARAASWRGRSVLRFALSYLALIYPDLPLPAIASTPTMALREVLIGPFLSDEPLLFVRERRRGPARLALGLLFVDRPADMVRLA